MILNKGLFLTFEGIDGSGKTMQLEMLTEDLRKANLKYLILREPGGTSISEQIRKVLLDRVNQEMIPETELLLFAAARAQLVQEVVKPALAAKSIVISDRFYDSTTAYQGFGRDMDVHFIQMLNTFATQGLQPDFTFYFDLSVETAIERLGKRTEKNDRIDLESKKFMEKTRQGYLSIAQKNPERIKVIDAERTPEEIFQDLKMELKQVIDLGG
ncbi:MAG: dTMP kinase [Clostridiaceae bacterium]|mgnify:CR=1 FL=1|jgi:dTMP kinase|nr:dTMP kinase [Bacillota bacterium]NLN51392.1 dTMP kinase [Clostridiaceae bacterium]